MRRNLAKLFIALFVLSGASTLLAACNTVAGAGEDISGASRKVQEHL